MGEALRRACAAAWLAAGSALFFALAPALAEPADRILEFDGGSGWINSAPVTPAELHGKVVLVDFWEYTCINCLRTLPYLREWYRRYHDRGFVIIGVHTPEFDFSGRRANVAAAAKRLDVAWPIVLDDQFTIWKRYGNSIWPHEYLYDQNGRLVENVVGEGGYPQTEARIQALLRAADPRLQLPAVMPLLPQDSYDKPGAVCYPHTPELVVERSPIADAPPSSNFAQDTDYADTASNPQDGAIYLQGFWHLTRQAAVSGESDGYVALRYHAIQLVVVMRPETGGAIRVNVTQNGKPVAREDAGKDLRFDEHGRSYVTVDAARAYDVVMNARFGTYDLRLSPAGSGLGVYDFAFESCEVPQK
ncbi:MAG: redoxin domain-containing protein [Candidatus Eremiobacteraeota bacterium]|nr:redoxin domain-containing protein [Candidatus Eremiobacteraeota bacterium]MBV8499770.1 redoxin domain-containing protein [Candidatus Eremiobacteraeota bacterium]